MLIIHENIATRNYLKFLDTQRVCGWHLCQQLRVNHKHVCCT